MIPLSGFVVRAASNSYEFDFEAFLGFLLQPGPMILNGVVLTIVIAVASQIIGTLLGFLAATGRRSRFAPARMIAGFYIWLFRGTPFLVQVAIIYFAGFPFFGLPLFGGYRWDDIQVFGLIIAGRILAGIFALSLNEGAYMAEIVRAGITAVDRGQAEAAQAVGMTSRQVMMRIVLPQALRTIVPPLGNQFNAMLKNTSLLSTISVIELYTAAAILQGQTFQPFEVFGAVAIYFLALTSVWTIIQSRIERRLDRAWGSTMSTPRERRLAKAARALGGVR